MFVTLPKRTNRMPHAKLTQRVKNITTGSVRSILVGLLNDILSSSKILVSSCSDLAYSGRLGYALRSFLARLARITSPRVSRRVNQVLAKSPALEVILD